MAFAQDATGGEYILLDDTSVGFNDSEGECGRVAENIAELFELLINISYWQNYLNKDLYKNDEVLKEYISETEKDFIETDYIQIQNELSKKLSVKIYDNKMELLKRFYKTAIREPQYIYTYTEEDETEISSEGSLIKKI